MPAEQETPDVGVISADNNDKIGLDDKVIISVIAICGLGGVLLTLFRLPAAPVLISILMATAMSALVYRFLGGIEAGTHFALGFIQVGGSLAALFGLIYFLNPILERQMSIDPEDPFPDAQWFAMGSDLLPQATLRLGAYGDVSAPPERTSTASLAITRNATEDAFAIASVDAERSFALGAIPAAEIASFMHVVFPGQKMDTYKSGLMPARSEDARLALSGLNWPFSLKTGVFDEGMSQYFLTDRSSGKIVFEGRLRNRQYEIAYVQDKPYFVTVAAANHQRADSSWVQFIIAELKPAVDFP